MKTLYTLLLCLLIAPQLKADLPILDRKITVRIEKQTLASALTAIGKSGSFYFSYSSSVLRPNRIVTVLANNKPVGQVLDELFRGELSYQQIGNHLVLQKKPKPKQTRSISDAENKQVKYNYVVSGYIRNKNNGDGVSEVSVYERSSLTGTVSQAFGYYTLNIVSRSPEIELRFSRSDFRDTVLKLKFSSNGVFDCPVMLEPVPAPMPEPLPVMSRDTQFTLTDTLPPAEQTSQSDTMPNRKMRVEDTRFGQWLISTAHRINEKNILDTFRRNWQFTLITPIGSNGTFSGLVENRFSVNFIAGYNGGLDGVEFGGLLNVLKKQMHGAQFSGFGNIVGGQVQGAQFAGFFNHNLGEVHAAQFAGFYNYNHRQASGAQMAGFINLNRGEMSGIQAAGFMNIAERMEGMQGAGFMNVTSNMTGMQGAGFMNIAGGDNVLMQGAGFMNVADKIEGMQGAGFMNICGYMQGVQAAGFMNVSGDMQGVQAAGFMNVGGGSSDLTQLAGFMNVADEIRGGQAAGFMNIARRVRGFQIGVFNIADTVDGLVLGVFNFIRNGLHQVEFSYNENGQYGIAYRSGKEWLYSNVMMTAQWPDLDSGTIITQGFGLGSNIRLSDAFRITTDLTVHQLTIDLRSDHLNLQNRLNVSLEWRPLKGFALFGGAALNHMINDTRHYLYETRFKDFGGTALWSRGGTYAQKVWSGWQFGVRLL